MTDAEKLAAYEKALELVNKQSEDDALWFFAETASEGYIQQELRKLHAAIERDEKVGTRVALIHAEAELEQVKAEVKYNDLMLAFIVENHPAVATAATRYALRTSQQAQEGK